MAAAQERLKEEVDCAHDVNAHPHITLPFPSCLTQAAEKEAAKKAAEKTAAELIVRCPAINLCMHTWIHTFIFLFQAQQARQRVATKVKA